MGADDSASLLVRVSGVVRANEIPLLTPHHDDFGLIADEISQEKNDSIASEKYRFRLAS